MYFFVEFTFGRIYQSVALISDSIDFLEDASVNILIAFALGWSFPRRKKASYLLALLLLVPGTFFIWNAIEQLIDPSIPQGGGMGIIGTGALLINIFCAFLIAKHRREGGGIVMAAYYSARNDALANIMIIVGGLITLRFASIWPDLIIGVMIFLMNADAAREIIKTSKVERDNR
jgi:Co/Zn/Cd efflux system component